MSNPMTNGDQDGDKDEDQKCARFNPGSPSFVENVRLAKVVGKQLEEDVLKSNKESYRPHNDSPSHTASVDDTPEGPCWTPPPPDTSSPSPPQYCYRFHKWWSVYWGEALEEGHQTTVDRVTTWRMFDKTEWKPVPRGYVVPHLGEEHERDGIIAEYQNAAFAAAEQGQYELNRQSAKEVFVRSREELRQAVLAEAAKEKAKFEEAAREEAARKEAAREEPAETETAAQTTKPSTSGRLIRSATTALTKSKASKVNHLEDYQTPSESDPSGSDFSTSHKALTKKRYLSSSDEGSSSEDGSESPSCCRPAKLPKLQLVPATPVSSSHSAMASSSQPMAVRKSCSTPAQPGRPSTEQMKFVENIHSTFYNSVKEGAI